jgi:hypothetical protein
MTQITFEKVMLERYGSYEELYSGIHHYETEEIKNSLGITVLKGGLRISPTWKTNGNFLEAINSTIRQEERNGIFATQDGGITPSKTVSVFPINNIPANIGDQVTIEGVSEKEYNGVFTITEIYDFYFKYELPEIPNNIFPIVSTSGKEQIIYTLTSNTQNNGNSYYYEYWDAGLGYSVLVPSTSLIRPVTNYEYELNLEEAKRNIYILKPRYLSVIFNDMEELMVYKEGGDQYVNSTLKRGDNIRLFE